MSQKYKNLSFHRLIDPALSYLAKLTQIPDHRHQQINEQTISDVSVICTITNGIIMLQYL